MSKKRTLDSFFKPVSQQPATLQQHQRPHQPDATSSKKQRVSPNFDSDLCPSADPPCTHPAYPFPIPCLPAPILSALGSASTKTPDCSTLSTAKTSDYNTNSSPPSTTTDPHPAASATCPASPGRLINDQPFLDLLYFEPFIPRPTAASLFTFLRSSLPFYRVRYRIQRGGVDTLVDTPRFTTVFGVDDTAAFSGPLGLVVERSSSSSSSTAGSAAARCARYRCRPRPLPACLDALRRGVERAAGARFNVCLVNYYASGRDGIAYHSDNERFLGPDPAIASVSLGATRDFCLRRKPGPAGGGGRPLKLPLRSGDVVVMRGKTQANWLHSVPKRKGAEGGGGRINVTFRRAMVRGGTENYYQYNVGDGPVYRWDEGRGEMRIWEPVEEEGGEAEGGADVKVETKDEDVKADD
ncbi:Oxoglutarate/iron-dependent oxygenase [Neofusicoccum parvum]|uniref:Oxoglutarate/iron-dependent oxygenase n=1 Tax=Neofusicoccum parvum TaxID=310453 RepID=A0ACB5RY37_9PEZI|nr:Oxoglutarate/iron-dependent oxygenase [Neofusicoccum parvum]